MLIYNYDATNGEYLGSSMAQASPLEPGAYLIPACATTTTPPAAEAGHARCWRNGVWAQIEDHRGETVYATATGAAQKITALGPLPAGVTTVAPGEHQAWDAATSAWVTDAAALAAAARAKRDVALTACEWLTTRHRDQTDAGSATTLTAAQYKELLTYRQALRDWPATTGWPDVALPTPPAWLEA